VSQTLAPTHLRTYRKKAGLSQRELADVLGVVTEWQVSQHERSLAIPLFLSAICYEIVFQIPISKLFPGFYEESRQNIERHLNEIEEHLKESTERGRSAAHIARKLEWLWERKSSGDLNPKHEVDQ
jgi:transcriptional regulator with XRE-family HTH domain